MTKTQIASDQAAIIVPCVQIDDLVMRCVERCQALFPEAEFLLLPDTLMGEAPELLLGQVVVTGPCSIAAKRNRGARLTDRPFLALIDSDAYPDENWLTNALCHLSEDQSIGIVGGPNISPPQQRGSERWVGLAMKSVFVSGGGNFRKMRSPSRWMDDHLPSCNLIVRRELWFEVGGMKESLFAGEDRDFCEKVLEVGRRILFAEDVVVFHKNRDLRAFVAHRFRYGATLLPILELARHRAGWKRRYLPLFLPCGWVLFLLTGPLAAIYPTWGFIYGGAVVLYALSIIAEALRLSERPSDWLGVLTSLLVGNLVPGMGILAVALRPQLNLADLLTKTRPIS